MGTQRRKSFAKQTSQYNISCNCNGHMKHIVHIIHIKNKNTYGIEAMASSAAEVSEIAPLTINDLKSARPMRHK
jgi:hypothetical protein